MSLLYKKVSPLACITQRSENAFCPGLYLLLVFHILNVLVTPYPATVVPPEFWLLLFPLSVFVLTQQ